MKFGQLIEYNMRNIFLEKSYTKYDTETLPRSFSKNAKLSTYLDRYSKVLYIEDYQKWLKLSCRPFAFISYKAFLKNKKRSETSLCIIFCMNLRRKIFLLLYSIIWPDFNIWLLLVREMLCNMCSKIVC